MLTMTISLHLLLMLLLSNSPEMVNSDRLFQHPDFISAILDVTTRSEGPPEARSIPETTNSFSAHFLSALTSPVRGRLFTICSQTLDQADVEGRTQVEGGETGCRQSLMEFPWLALVRRREEDFSGQLEHAFIGNASAFLVYDSSDEPRRSASLFREVGDSMAVVSIGSQLGEELAVLVAMDGIQVTVAIRSEISSTATAEEYSSTVLFPLFLLALLITATTVWLLFYCFLRLRSLRREALRQRRLASACRLYLDMLPVRSLCEHDMYLEENQCCAVCLDPYSMSDRVTLMPCGHYFHQMCIEPWLLKTMTCPVCKLNILKYYGLGSTSEESLIQIEESEMPTPGTHSLLLGPPEAPANNSLLAQRMIARLSEAYLTRRSSDSPAGCTLRSSQPHLPRRRSAPAKHVPNKDARV